LPMWREPADGCMPENRRGLGLMGSVFQSAGS
jgi:hypothetical protein